MRATKQSIRDSVVSIQADVQSILVQSLEQHRTECFVVEPTIAT